jgi:hypothetical protein
MISELRLEVENGHDLFGSVMEAARSGRIAVDSAHRLTFAAICAAVWNSDLYESVCGELRDKVTTENVVGRFDSCQRLDATSPQSSNSLRHISLISYVVPMH